MGATGQKEDEAAAEDRVVEAADIRFTLFTTPPRTPADALAVLNWLAHPEYGLPNNGWIKGQESAVVLLRDCVAALAAKGVHTARTLSSAAPDPSSEPAPSLPPDLGAAHSADPKGAGLPDANPVMPTDPDAIGPNAVAVVAFWEGYMGMDGVVMDWFDDGDDDRLEARFAELAEEFQAAVATAGPPIASTNVVEIR